jgi:hypothetical protein
MSTRSWKVCALAISPFAWLSVTGCSSANSASPQDAGGNLPSMVPDAGAGADASGSPDGGAIPGTDSGAAMVDGSTGCPAPVPAANAAPPAGTLLASGDSLSVRGVTSDGYAVYSDDVGLQLYAVPIAGGSPQSIGALGSNFWVVVVGQVVFVWSNVTSANVGALTTWSSARGPHAIAPASFGILAASSSDGTQVLYIANVDAQGQAGDVFVSGTDGTGATRLLQGQQLAGCFPQLGFAGSYAIASHCNTARGAGPSTTVTSFQSPAWTPADLVSSAQNGWSADTAGTMVLVSTAGGVSVVPIGGGAATTIDATGFMGQLIEGGKTAVYGTTAGALRMSSTTAPLPTTLAPAFGGFYGVSPSQDDVLYYQNQASTGTDLYLVSTASPGAPQPISTVTNGAVNGDPFTTDSTYALYSTSNDACTGAATFAAFPVNGGSSIPLGSNVWGDSSATGAKVVFNDHYAATGGQRFGRADIESVDLAAGTTPTLVVSQADAVIELTPAADQIVYSWSLQPGALAGIYVTPVP